MVRIAFLGLGGVGGYFGAKLARTYAGSNDVEIIFLARERTADVIRTNGIKLITPTEEFIAHPHLVSSSGKQVGPVDYLICTVKSYDLEESLKQFSDCIGPKTAILPLQNGIDSVSRVQRLFPENEVWSGCVYIVSRITAPGVITETGNIHQFHFGSTQRDDDNQVRLYRLIFEAHDEVWMHHQQTIGMVVWEKFVFISVVASLTSYLDVCIGKILEIPANRALLMKALEEITAVASAENISLREDIIAASVNKMGRLAYDTTSSMHSDFQKHAPTELESLTAYVVQLADGHGVEVPLYRTLLQGLRLRQSL